jgi:hypothetical protein
VSAGIVTVFEIEPSLPAVVVPSVTGVECNVSVSVEPACHPVSVTVIEPPGATDGALRCTDDVVLVVVLPAVLIVVVVVGFSVVVVGWIVVVVVVGLIVVVVVVGATVVVVVVGATVVVVVVGLIVVVLVDVELVVDVEVVLVVVPPPPIVVDVVGPPTVVVVVDELVVDVDVDVDVEVVGFVVVVVPPTASGSVIVKNAWSPVAAELFDDTRSRHVVQSGFPLPVGGSSGPMQLNLFCASILPFLNARKLLPSPMNDAVPFESAVAGPGARPKSQSLVTLQ